MKSRGEIYEEHIKVLDFLPMRVIQCNLCVPLSAPGFDASVRPPTMVELDYYLPYFS